MKTGIRKILVLAILTLLVCYGLFGFYFERYEPLAVSLISGVFTPGMLYDDFFYLAHLGIVKLFAKLFNLFPEIPWLSLFQYSYLLAAYALIVWVFTKLIRSKWLLYLFVFGFSIFFMEYYVFHVMTRVSYVLSFAVLLFFLYMDHRGWLRLWQVLSLSFLFVLAVMLRPEPPSIIGLITGVFYLITKVGGGWWNKLSKTLKIFLLPGAICLFAILWVFFSIQNSEEFYMQIEPEVEYELMARNNFVPIAQMENRVDSLRYEAIYRGIWGDASTNEADFLRSLIGEDNAHFDFLMTTAEYGLKSSAANCLPLVYLHIAVFVLSFILLLIFRPGKAIRVLLFEFVFLAIIVLMSFKVKMVETSLSPMLFAGTVLLLYYYFIHVQIGRGLILIFMFLLSFIQFDFLAKQSAVYEQGYQESKIVRKLIEEEFAGKKLFIDRIAFEFIFKGFRPFQTMEFNHLDKIYLFDSQHMSTVQPYKSYLARDCNCDPNNYREYFAYILKEQANSVIFIDENNVPFYQVYLEEVHGLPTHWISTEFKAGLGREAECLGDLECFELK